MAFATTVNNCQKYPYKKFIKFPAARLEFIILYDGISCDYCHVFLHFMCMLSSLDFSRFIESRTLIFQLRNLIYNILLIP